MAFCFTRVSQCSGLLPIDVLFFFALRCSLRRIQHPPHVLHHGFLLSTWVDVDMEGDEDIPWLGLDTAGERGEGREREGGERERGRERQMQIKKLKKK